MSMWQRSSWMNLFESWNINSAALRGTEPAIEVAAVVLCYLYLNSGKQKWGENTLGERKEIIFNNASSSRNWTQKHCEQKAFTYHNVGCRHVKRDITLRQRILKGLNWLLRLSRAVKWKVCAFKKWPTKENFYSKVFSATCWSLKIDYTVLAREEFKNCASRGWHRQAAVFIFCRWRRLTHWVHFSYW